MARPLTAWDGDAGAPHPKCLHLTQQMSAMTKEQIYAKALKSEDGKYLLPRRQPADRPSQEWVACDTLVRTGHARWISGASSYWPGIVLTGRPLDHN